MNDYAKLLEEIRKANKDHHYHWSHPVTPKQEEAEEKGPFLSETDVDHESSEIDKNPIKAAIKEMILDGDITLEHVWHKTETNNGYQFENEVLVLKVDGETQDPHDGYVLKDNRPDFY